MTRLNPTSRLLASVALLTLLLAGCKKPEVEPLDTLVANAGPDQTVQVGQLVTLDGTASKDGAGKPLTYQWSITRKPARSIVTLTVPTTARPTFAPDETGEYELTLTVYNGTQSRSDQVLVLASVAQPLTIDNDITVKTVLADRIANPDLPDYIVPKSIAVKHELTIQPGVVIAFERDVRFDVNDRGGILIARGTAEKRIRFVGLNQTRGFWQGIMFYSTSNANVMEYADVQHAGSQTLLDNTKMGMALFTESQLALKNTLFADNDGYGLFVQHNALLRDFAANTFARNAEAGIVLPAELVSRLDVASIFTSGNGRNVVDVNGDYVRHGDASTGEIVWKGFTDKTPYRLLTSLAVREGWRLSPGVTIEAARDVAIRIDENGYLNATGTDAQKIRFTGIGTSAAYWQGILCQSPSTRNSIENAEIINAGSRSIIAGKRASLALYGEDATITVRKTRISGSGGYGILIGYGSLLNDDASTSNTFDRNAQSDIEQEN